MWWWWLFKAAKASSSARASGLKRIDVTKIGTNAILW